jgi:hypothetical protein
MVIDWESIIDKLVKVASIGSTIFVAIQVWFLKKDYKVKNDKAEREKAIELSKFYCEKIIPKISYFFYIFKNIGVDKILGDLKYADLKEFDNSEINDLIGKKNLSTINQKVDNVDLNILINASNLLQEKPLNEFLNDLTTLEIEKSIQKQAKREIASTKSDEKNEILDKKDDEKKKQQINQRTYIYYKSKYCSEFESTITETLNFLEYFCMSFNSGIADEETVYQSLHQSFLGCVKVLYFWIAQQNLSGKDKYYTNIIKLFNKWSERYNEQCTKEVELQRGIAHVKKSIKK